MKVNKQSKDKNHEEASEQKLRLDKWLWAARFFKTRKLATEAVNGGQVHYNAQRVKSSKNVSVGAELRIKQGFSRKTVIVEALSAKRGPATQAATLYSETQLSIETREKEAAARKAANISQADYGKRPDKKSRRVIHRFKRQEFNDEQDK